MDRHSATERQESNVSGKTSTNIPLEHGGDGYLYKVTLIAALGGFLFGYDLSLISGAIIFLKQEFALSPYWVGVVTGSAILGCPFGPLAGLWIADSMGRKWSLMFSA